MTHRWTATVSFLCKNRWTTAVAVTVEGTMAAATRRAIAEGRKKVQAQGVKAGVRLYGVTVKLQRQFEAPKKARREEVATDVDLRPNTDTTPA